MFRTYRRIKRIGKHLILGSSIFGTPVVIAGVCGLIGLAALIYLKRKDLKIKFLTIHKSKGLQADYVVIINNKVDKIDYVSITKSYRLQKKHVKGKKKDKHRSTC